MRKIKYEKKTNRNKSDDIFTVRAIIEMNGKLLLHSFMDTYGTYITLGGHVQKGETLWEALQRELKEEAGVTLIADERKPDLIYLNNHYYVISPKEVEFGGDRTHTDGGRLALVTRQEMLEANEMSIGVPIIHADNEALDKLLKV